MKTIQSSKSLFLATAALCLLGSLATAANLSQRGPISFDIYDTNKDNLVSESEFYDARAKRQVIKANQGMPMRNAGNAPIFEQFDTNKDGKLTKVELLEGQNAQMQKNRANRGNRQNMQGTNMQRNMPSFESFDLNSDGYLTESEMNTARSKRMTKNAEAGKMMRNAGNSTAFSKIDVNGDGKVSKSEFLANQKRKRG